MKENKVRCVGSGSALQREREERRVRGDALFEMQMGEWMPMSIYLFFNRLALIDLIFFNQRAR